MSVLGEEFDAFLFDSRCVHVVDMFGFEGALYKFVRWIQFHFCTVSNLTPWFAFITFTFEIPFSFEYVLSLIRRLIVVGTQIADEELFTFFHRSNCDAKFTIVNGIVVQIGGATVIEQRENGSD